jgi:hypothetical protein
VSAGNGQTAQETEAMTTLPAPLEPAKLRRPALPTFLRVSTLTDLLELAKVLAESQLVPQTYRGKSADIVVAVGMGGELGLGPFQALQAIYVVGGRPSLYVEAALAIVRASGLLESLEVTGTDQTATATAARFGQGQGSETFTMEDARRMGLAGRNQAYQTQAAWMLQTRAIGRVLHRLFPDVLKGLGIVDPMGQPVELDDAPPPSLEPPKVINGGRLAQLTERLTASAPATAEPEHGPDEPPHPATTAEPESSMERSLQLSVVMTLRDKVSPALWATSLSKRGLTEAGLGTADVAALIDLEADLRAVVATTAKRGPR